MGKPSIFSKEYERKMKRRKRNFIFFSLIIVVLACAVVLKFVYNPVNFDNIKNKIQAWIDSDTTQSNEIIVNNEDANENANANENPVVEQEPAEEYSEEYIDIVQSSGNIAKAVYIETNGEKTFEEVKDLDNGVTFDISPSKKELIISDVNAVITLYNVDGSHKVISKDKYISTSGTVFTKDNTLSTHPDYLWNSSPKFVNDKNIIFITNRPYFGSAALKQYLWMTNTENETDKIYWELAASKIEIGAKEEKGLEVTIDGRKYYIAEDGSYLQ